MDKRKIAALLLCACLVFTSGCSLIDIDQEKADALENAKVLAEYKDTDITKGQVVAYMTQSLAQEGMTLKDVESGTYWESFKTSAIQEMVLNELSLEKAAELGLDQLTEDETREIDDQYSGTLESIQYYADYIAQSAVSADESLDYDEQYQQAIDTYLGAMGYTQDTLRSGLERDFLLGKIKDHYIKNISVTDEEVKTTYDNQLSLQQGNIENDPSFVQMQASLGSRVLYYPEGYMNARHIFLAFDDEIKSAAAAASGEDNTGEYDRLISEGKAALQAKIDDIEKRLAQGEDFGVLMGEYNEDSTYKIEPYSTVGVEVGPYQTNSVPGYLDAAAALTAQGQVSKPLVNYNGVYFIQCVKLLAGAVPYEDVREDLTASLLASKQAEEWTGVTQGWIDEAKEAGTLKMYPERY